MTAIIRAYKDYHKWRRTYDLKQDHLPWKKLLDMQGVFHGIMIWRYYFLGRKEFSKLEHEKER